MRLATAAFFGIFALGCATQRPWRPKFDARCDCGGEAKEPESVASDDVYHPDASLLDAAMQRLGKRDVVKDATIVAFLDHPQNFDEGVQLDLKAHKAAAETAARAKADEMARAVDDDLEALRRERRAALEIGDQSAAIEAQTMLWLRYDDGMKTLRETTELVVREVLRPPYSLIGQTCADIGATLLGDIDLTPNLKTMLVRQRLEGLLVARHAEQRDAVAARIVDAIVAEHRLRWLPLVTK